MTLFSVLLLSLLLSPAKFCLATEVESREQQKPSRIETTYDVNRNSTTVRLKPMQISGEKAQYQSVHIAAAFSYPGREFTKPETVDFEVQTIVKTKLKIDLYVVFVADSETIFLSSERSALRRPVPGKRWIGERLVFRMPYETLIKITKARAVAIKMDGVEFVLSASVLDNIREFARHMNPSLNSQ